MRLHVQGLVLRAATYVVLRWGSSLSSFSPYKFFTYCWQRLSASSQVSLRKATAKP